MKSTPQERETIKRMVADGRSMAEIGKALGKVPSWVWDRVYDMRLRGEIAWPGREITLPKVSILDGPELTLQDYYAGRAAAAAAGF